jgi:hypothetical protein
MAREAQRRPGGGGAVVSFGICSAAENSSSSAKVNQDLRANQHLPADQLKILKIAEESEKDLLWDLAFQHDDEGTAP